MKIFIDAQLSPVIAVWLRKDFNLDAAHVSEINLESASDHKIFEHIRTLAPDGIIFTKDRDFVDLLQRNGPPPKVVWITCGNTSNNNLKNILKNQISIIIKLLDQNEELIEITDNSL